MSKRYLFAPGPTPVPEEILLAMARPLIHHRTPEFEQLMAEVREGLCYVFQTSGQVLVFCASGSGAMEAAVTNILCAGDSALVVQGGKFGERWAEICRAYGVRVHLLEVPWGEPVEPELVARALEAEPGIRAVLVQASETSTGVMHPVRALGEIVRRYPDTLLVVDAISALGAVELPVDRWGLDVVVAGSQKGLMLPPGLGFASVSEKAWRAVGRATLPHYYFDFAEEAKALRQNTARFTPAISLVVGLRDALERLRAEGLDQIFARHARLAEATRQAVRALGLELYARRSPSNALTAVAMPEGVDGNKVEQVLSGKYGITVAGGQDRARGRIIRIAHLGYADRFDVITAIAALEMTLNDLGCRVELGRGVRTAMELLQ
ncbi:MAG: alanine--glyoxylate aminotransferase family protein [Deltaproteobacteria bacterium]|nr:alanine--glyoxylate aminotransferase family protein [Deltaproteobacteria bacterium]